jgi:uncharacterized protein (AIM24 family)
METLVASPTTSPSTSASASFGTVRATTSGELVPVTEVSLAQNDSIFFEHHIFLWKDPSVTITAKAMKGLGKRILAGLPVYVTEAHGPGRIAFSRDSPGQVLFLEMKPGTQVHVRDH